ncbi:YceI like family protein [gamma proteobacterium HdN1]|nr:YceI like family protein [gamma proteobacterium HdN1]
MSFAKRIAAAALLRLPLLSVTSVVQAAPEQYVMDTQNKHAFVQFKISHLGFSWVLGTFDNFTGNFTLDQDAPDKSSVSVDIDTNSVNTNYAERDKHLRAKDVFNVAKFPKATFVSTKVEKTGDKTANVTGNMTIKGVTKPVTLAVTYIGGGKDPWGGYRQGFEATTDIRLKDFGIDLDLGPAAQVAHVFISVEGIRK